MSPATRAAPIRRPIMFDFRIDGCTQLMLANSSFKLAVLTTADVGDPTNPV